MSTRDDLDGLTLDDLATPKAFAKRRRNITPVRVIVEDCNDVRELMS